MIIVSDGFEELSTASEHPDARALQTTLMQDGEADAAFVGREGVQAARTHHSRVREELPIRALALSKADPALPTEYRDAE